MFYNEIVCFATNGKQHERKYRRSREERITKALGSQRVYWS